MLQRPKRLMVHIAAHIVIVIAALQGSVHAEMQLTIEFVDEPPYQTCWWPWANDRFRISTSILNMCDSSYAVERMHPCNDCNPKFFLEDIQSGQRPPRSFELDVYYFLRDSSFMDLAPGQVYRDTIDIAKYVRWDMKKGKRYRLWVEYRPWLDYASEDTLRITQIWRLPLVSDTLVLTVP
ncbi:MAG: hypothetical protein ABIE70_02855 [bacterium]